MTEEEKSNKIVFEFDISNVLDIVGKWFESKMIHYSDEMFSDYYEHVKRRILPGDSLNDYLLLRVNELIFKLLGDYHDKKKEAYKEVTQTLKYTPENNAARKLRRDLRKKLKQTDSQ